jgi:uncharacterized protein
MNPILVYLPRLPEDGMLLRGEATAEELDLAEYPDFELEEPLRWELWAQLVSDRLLVRGLVTTLVRTACVRCAVFFSTRTEESSFLRDYLVQGGQAEVDLSAELREWVLLHISTHPVCSPTCLGLCAQCGKNLNDGLCACQPSEPEGPWDALDGVKWQ